MYARIGLILFLGCGCRSIENRTALQSSALHIPIADFRDVEGIQLNAYPRTQRIWIQQAGKPLAEWAFSGGDKFYQTAAGPKLADQSSWQVSANGRSLVASTGQNIEVYTRASAGTFERLFQKEFDPRRQVTSFAVDPQGTVAAVALSEPAEILRLPIQKKTSLEEIKDSKGNPIGINPQNQIYTHLVVYSPANKGRPEDAMIVGAFGQTIRILGKEQVSFFQFEKQVGPIGNLISLLSPAGDPSMHLFMHFYNPQTYSSEWKMIQLSEKFWGRILSSYQGFHLQEFVLRDQKDPSTEPQNPLSGGGEEPLSFFPPTIPIIAPPPHSAENQEEEVFYLFSRTADGSVAELQYKYDFHTEEDKLMKQKRYALQKTTELLPQGHPKEMVPFFYRRGTDYYRPLMVLVVDRQGDLKLNQFNASRGRYQ